MMMCQVIVLVFSIFLCVFVDPSQAWTNTACIKFSSRDYTVMKATSAQVLAITDQNDHSQEEMSKSNIMNELDIGLRLQVALQEARDADHRYGLCTPASTRAWRIVDDLYLSSWTSREVEDTVKNVLGDEKSIWSAFEV